MKVLRRIAEGDLSALTDLERTIRVVLSTLHIPRSEWDDAAQEITIRLLRLAPTFRAETDTAEWRYVHKAILHITMDVVRKMRTWHRHAAHAGLSPLATYKDHRLGRSGDESVGVALRAMTTGARATIEMFYRTGSTKAVGAALGIPPKSAGERVRQAHRATRRRIHRLGRCRPEIEAALCG